MNAPADTSGTIQTEADGSVIHAFACNLGDSGDATFYCLRTSPQGDRLTYLYRTRQHGMSSRYTCGQRHRSDSGLVTCPVSDTLIKRFSTWPTHQPRPRLMLHDGSTILLYALDRTLFRVNFTNEWDMWVSPHLTYVTDDALAAYERAVDTLHESPDDERSRKKFARVLARFESSGDPAANGLHPVPLWCLEYLRHIANPCGLCDADGADPMPQVGLVAWNTRHLVGRRASQ